MSPSKRNESRRQSVRIAFCGLTAALSVALMLSGGLIPVATYCAPMAAAVLLLPILLEFGKKTAWTVFAAAAAVTLMLGVDKEAALFYLAIGYYPIVKWDIDRVHSRGLRILFKLLVFNLSIGLMYALLCFVLHVDAITAEFGEMGPVMLFLFVLGLNLCLFIYDRLLMPLSILYWNRIRPQLRFLAR